MSKTRRNHGSVFKAKVALEALKGEQTVVEIASKHGLHPTLVNEWKRQLADGASAVFPPARSARAAARSARPPEPRGRPWKVNVPPEKPGGHPLDRLRSASRTAAARPTTRATTACSTTRSFKPC